MVKAIAKSAATGASRSAPYEAALRELKPCLLRREDGPLYRQLLDRLRAPIDSGALGVGSALPREAVLAERFGVSLITVRQALRELEIEGLIKKQTAKPAVVAAPTLARRKPLVFQSLAAIAASSADRRLVIRSYRKEQSAQACEAFGLAPGTACHCLRAVLREQQQTITQTTFYFPPVIGSRLKRADFDDVVVFRAVQRHLGLKLSRAQIKVHAELADSALAATLGCETGAAVLATAMLYFSSAGEAVELTLSKSRADKVSITWDAPNDLL